MSEKEKQFVLAASVGAITFTLGKILSQSPLYNVGVFLIIFSLMICSVITIKSIEHILKSLILRKSIYYLIAIAISLSTMIIFMINIIGPMRPITATRAICASNLSGLCRSMMVYSNDNEYLYPDTDNWCDLLIIYADASPKYMICPGSDAVIGESSYAMNINLNGRKLKDVDPDAVVLFETVYGKDPNGRDVTVSSRYSYKVLKEKGEDVSFFGKRPEKRKVYENRWNRYGGPEMLTAENHKGLGANVLFADCSVRWIPKEDFNNLNWGNEANIE